MLIILMFSRSSLTNESTMYYKLNQLPEYIQSKLPLRGNNDIYTGTDNEVRVSKPMLAYMITFNTTIDTTNWALTGDEGEHMEIPRELLESLGVSGVKTKIYQRTMLAGIYSFSNLGAMYLFSDNMGKIVYNK